MDICIDLSAYLTTYKNMQCWKQTVVNTAAVISALAGGRDVYKSSAHRFSSVRQCADRRSKYKLRHQRPSGGADRSIRLA